MIEDCCFENNIIDEVEEKPTAEPADVLRLKLEFEHEERLLTPEEAQRAREAAEAEAQKACEEAQKAHDAVMLEQVLC